MQHLKPLETSDVYVLITADPVPIQAYNPPLPSLAVPEALKAAQPGSSTHVLLPVVYNPVVPRADTSSHNAEVEEWRSHCRLVCAFLAVLYVASCMLWPTLVVPVAGACAAMVGYGTATLLATNLTKRVQVLLLLMQLWLNICMIILDVWVVVTTFRSALSAATAESYFLVAIVLAILYLHQHTNVLFRRLRRHSMES